jgi:hypothetical protein
MDFTSENAGSIYTDLAVKINTPRSCCPLCGAEKTIDNVRGYVLYILVETFKYTWLILAQSRAKHEEVTRTGQLDFLKLIRRKEWITR